MAGLGAPVYTGQTMARPKTTKITSRTNLHTLCPVGATILATMKPLTTSDFDDLADAKIDPDSLLARGAGAVRARVEGHTSCGGTPGLVLRSLGDSHYRDDVGVSIYRDEIVSIQVLELPAPPQKATFGTAKLVWERGQLRCNGTLVSQTQVAAVATARGWVYQGAPDPGGYYWDDNMKLTHEAMVAGCARIPLGQLDAALDWCAECFGWGEASQA